MRIDIKEIQDLLYNCNVNFYEMYIDTECECICIELNELIENIALDDIMEELNDLFDDVDYEDKTIFINLYELWRIE